MRMFNGCDPYFEVKTHNSKISFYKYTIYIYNTFIYFQAPRSSRYLFEFRIKKHDYLTNVSFII